MISRIGVNRERGKRKEKREERERETMMKNFLRCQLLLFMLFFIIISSSVRASRFGNFVQETGHPAAVDDFSEITLEEAAVEDVIKRRMDIESNDYQGSGANNRHTPMKP